MNGIKVNVYEKVLKEICDKYPSNIRLHEDVLKMPWLRRIYST